MSVSLLCIIKFKRCSQQIFPKVTSKINAAVRDDFRILTAYMSRRKAWRK